MKNLCKNGSFLAVVLICGLSFGCVPEKTRKSEQRNLAWCVNLCLKDIFDNMHNNGESWGTGSSSMDGMTQDDTFNTIKIYCESIYSDGCYSVDYRSKSAIHGTWGGMAGAER